MATFSRQNVIFDLDYGEYKPIYSQYIPDNSPLDAKATFVHVLASNWHTIEPVTISIQLPQININDIIYRATSSGAKITLFLRHWVPFQSVTIKTVEGTPVITDVLNWKIIDYDELWPLLNIEPVSSGTYYNLTRYGLISGSNFNPDFNIGVEPETNLTGLDKTEYAAAYFSFNQYPVQITSEEIQGVNYNIYQMLNFFGPQVTVENGGILVNYNLNNFSSPPSGGAPVFSTASCEFVMPQVVTFKDNDLFATNQIFKRILFSVATINGSNESGWFEVILGLKSY